MSKKHFFDVGANIGQTFDDYLIPRSAEFSDHRIWCFEPSPRHLPALMEKVAGVGFDVHVCPFGLSGVTNSPGFFQKDDPRGDSFCSYLASDHLTTNLEPGFTLHAGVFSAAEFILTHTAPEDRIILKLDCEGSEYELLSHLVLDVAALARIERIMVEWHTIKPDPLIDSVGLSYLYERAGLRLERWCF